jgi:hypothetical protein
MLEHRCWNTDAGTQNAGTQMLNTEQMLEHRDAGTHKCWNTNAEHNDTDAGTQMQLMAMLEHKCWNTMLEHNAETRMLEHRCWNTDAETQMLEHRC